MLIKRLKMTKGMAETNNKITLTTRRTVILIREMQKDRWRMSRHRENAFQQDFRATSRVGGGNPPPMPQVGPLAVQQEHMAENIPEFGYIDNPFTPWIMSHALPHGFQFAKQLKE
jgi:hypothetical protein